MKKRLIINGYNLLSKEQMRKVSGGGGCNAQCTGTCDAGKYGTGSCVVTLGTSDCSCHGGGGGIQ